jgi:hypothetical protein
MSKESRNEVFKSKEDVQAGMQNMMSSMSQKKMEDDLGFEVPVELVPLPSNGLVYSENHPLRKAEFVEIKSMTAKEEDILTSRALIKQGTVLTYLIKSCVTNKSIDPDSLLAGDKNALMTSIRITGYGAEYPVEITCPVCDHKYKNEFDLNDLPIKRFKIDPIEENENIFSFMLPGLKKEVHFSFLTGADEEELTKQSDRKKKKLKTSIDSLVSARLIKSVKYFDGVTDRSKIANIIRHLPARDSLALRNFIDDNEPGIEMRQFATCPDCGEDSEVTIPLGVEFFWPQLSRS